VNFIARWKSPFLLLAALSPIVFFTSIFLSSLDRSSAGTRSTLSEPARDDVSPPTVFFYRTSVGRLDVLWLFPHPSLHPLAFVLSLGDRSLIDYFSFFALPALFSSRHQKLDCTPSLSSRPNIRAWSSAFSSVFVFHEFGASLLYIQSLEALLRHLSRGALFFFKSCFIFFRLSFSLIFFLLLRVLAPSDFFPVEKTPARTWGHPPPRLPPPFPPSFVFYADSSYVPERIARQSFAEA